MINIKFHANWCSDEEIREHFNRCTINNDYRWKDLYITIEDDYDFFIVMNHPRHLNFDSSKTIIFQSEPLYTRMRWGAFFKPDKNIFFKAYDVENYHNVDKWYVSLNYGQLVSADFTKTKTMSGIVSAYYWLEGHKDRVNFLSYLDQLPYYEHFGRGNLGFLKSYKGELQNKENGLIPYKYHFNAENSYEKNYFTEKIIDAILCECLCFYDGCPNIEEFIDPRAFIKINLKRPNEAIKIIKSCIENNEYGRRLEFIKMAKEKLMNELNPLNIVYKIVKGEV